jgi:capsule polysaccharide export protein KpsE/RkpR
VRPSLPQSAAYPRIFLETLLTAALAFMFWVIALLSLRAIFDR